MALKRQSDLIRVNNIISLLDVDVIEITADKLENILNKRINNIKAPRDIISAIGLFVGLTGTLLTSEFHDTLNIPADMWKGIFFLSAILSFFHMVRVAYNRCFRRDGVESIIKAIKDADDNRNHLK